jgi:hypothetical protein
VRVTIEWHDRTREDVERWVRSLPGHDPERRALANWVLDELIGRLQSLAEIPPGAIEIPGWDPPRYWWRGLPHVWISISIHDEPWSLSTFVRGRVRRIMIWRLLRERPDESTP